MMRNGLLFLPSMTLMHANYVLCSFVSKGFIIRNNLINNYVRICDMTDGPPGTLSSLKLIIS